MGGLGDDALHVLSTFIKRNIIILLFKYEQGTKIRIMVDMNHSNGDPVMTTRDTSAVDTIHEKSS